MCLCTLGRRHVVPKYFYYRGDTKVHVQIRFLPYLRSQLIKRTSLAKSRQLHGTRRRELSDLISSFSENRLSSSALTHLNKVAAAYYYFSLLNICCLLFERVVLLSFPGRPAEWQTNGQPSHAVFKGTRAKRKNRPGAFVCEFSMIYA